MADINDRPTFATYGKSFQEKIVQALLTDHRWAEQVLEVFDVNYFELKYLQFLADKYFTHAKKYKQFPTLQLLVSIIRHDLKAAGDIVLRDQIIDFLQRMKMNPDPGDLPYVRDKALDFCRKQALKAAFEKSIDLMSTEKYETIVDVIKKAVAVGTVSSKGHDLFNDIEARFVTNKRECVPIGIPQLDREGVLNGGIGGGELLSVIGSTGAGKSHFLVSIGGNALLQKKNVLHYTFELSEINTGVRYDSFLCDIDSNDIIARKDDVIKFYEENKKSLGRLIIKEYPMNTATVYTLRAHIERLSIEGFVPDIILIDYADIMRSSRQFDSLRHELKLVYEELRALGQELHVPVATASQSNKEGTHSDVIDETNMSEGFGKAFVADIIATLSRKPIEKSSGRGRIFLAKNRAGRDGLLYPIKINTARSKFEVTGDQMSMESAKSEDETEYKKSLRKKWEELQNDPGIKIAAVADAEKETSSGKKKQ